MQIKDIPNAIQESSIQWEEGHYPSFWWAAATSSRSDFEIRQNQNWSANSSNNAQFLFVLTVAGDFSAGSSGAVAIYDDVTDNDISRSGKENAVNRSPKKAGGSAAALTTCSVASTIGKRGRTRDDSPAKFTKRTRTKKESTNDADNSIHPAILFLTKCGASRQLLEIASNLLKRETENPVKKVIIDLLVLLGNENVGAEELRTKFISLKEDLRSAFMSISGDEYDGFLNFGDCLSPKTELLIIKNYAPLSCFGKKGIRGDFNLIWRSNACILQYLKVLPRSLYKEARGEDWTEELAESIGECISFIDLHLLVPKKKKT